MSRPLLPSPACPAVHGRLGALLDHLDTRSLHGQRIVVTGGTGFFGYWLLSLFDLLHRQGVTLKAIASEMAMPRLALIGIGLM